MRRSHIVCLAGAALLAGSISTSAHAAPTGDAAWNKLADQYFDQAFFPYQPTNGTLAGFHQYDAQLERYDRASIAKQTATLHDFERRVSGFSRSMASMSGPRPIAQLVLNNIHSTLLTLETIKPWEKNPDLLLHRHHQQRLLADGAQIRAARRPPPIAHRARTPDARGTHRCADRICATARRFTPRSRSNSSPAISTSFVTMSPLHFRMSKTRSSSLISGRATLLSSTRSAATNRG